MEFMSQALEDWACGRGVELDFIRSSPPTTVKREGRLTAEGDPLPVSIRSLSSFPSGESAEPRTCSISLEVQMGRVET